LKAALYLALLSLAACQSIAGIKDRHLASTSDDAGSGSGGPALASAKLCDDYCSVLMDTCKDPLQVYPSEQVCKNVCMQLPAGDDDEDGNTVECRNRIAVEANNAKEGLEESCPQAGPGGAGTCGDDCETYCYLFAKACPNDALDDCEAKCKGLTDKSTLDAVTVDHDGDSLQCRLVHVSNSIGDPKTHCKHARIAHPEVYCSDPPEADFDCQKYCKLVNAECTGKNAVYESEAQCRAVCAALGPGKVGDQSVDPKTDTMSCRLWHAYTAVVTPDVHCSHAGPGGDGHCGDGSEAPNCAPYCKLLQAACKDQFEDAFGGDIDKCREACTPREGSAAGSGYSVKTAAEDPKSQQCRMLYATRAIGGDADACDDAFGEGKNCHD
jgi:hypothetical protein